jgi:hypothetical protein
MLEEEWRRHEQGKQSNIFIVQLWMHYQWYRMLCACPYMQSNVTNLTIEYPALPTIL